MNISTGGPHILLFERDQQLTTLLMSEFQLAGYECHVARTAVEVFDAIARYPVRLVLVDLAQAATTRREFWVALDTQCRGRGVQVMTFQCANIAGYGPHDPDERTYVVADMHVDGMLGLMNLVDGVRSRVPVMGVSNTLPRVSRTSPSLPTYPQTSAPSYNANAASLSSNTAPRSTIPTESRSTRSNPPAYTQTAPQMSAPVATPPSFSPSLPPLQVPGTAPTGISTGSQSSQPPSYTDKIRAVLYPTPRARSGQSSMPASQESEGATPASQTQSTNAGERTERSAYENAAQVAPVSNNLTMLQRLANGQSSGESGLAQLSRMVQESRPIPAVENYDATSRQPQQGQGTMTFDTSSLTAFGIAHPTPTNFTAPTPHYAAQTGMQPLRASPIEDLPIERGERGERGERTTSTFSPSQPGLDDTNRMDSSAGSPYTNYGQPPASPALPPQSVQSGYAPLASIAATSTQVPPQPRPMPEMQPGVPQAPAPVTLAQTQLSTRAEVVEKKMEEPTISLHREEQPRPPERTIQFQSQQPQARVQPQTMHEEPMVEDVEEPRVTYEQVKLAEQTTEVPTATQVAQVVQALAAHAEIHNDTSDGLQSAHALNTPNAPSNATLLDIVQSLPPMPPSAQQQVLSGRATRSLGSVLLEGHLVPHNRLEVAQNIQRMLRGVDLNYQLGEILLMFKLLTPDQLLAASLVSYGLITTQQIAALGRIRQELHAMGLEYDLETLLILFRILTPEQLREVRSSWQS